jgi:hypothetical protein
MVLRAGSSGAHTRGGSSWPTWVRSPGGEAAVFNPDTYHGTMYVGRGLLQAVAAGEAFDVTMRHLALICLAAAAVTLFARNIKGRGMSAGH